MEGLISRLLGNGVGVSFPFLVVSCDGRCAG